MTADGTRGTAGVPGEDGLPRSGAALVVSEDDTLHDTTCERFVAEGSITYPIRVVADGEPCADTDRHYTAGVYDGLDLTEAGIAVTDALANLASTDTGLPDGAVHVCVDGLPTPTSDTERRDLFRFLHALTSSVRNRDGGCHVHLHNDLEDEFVATVAPVFDRIVELWETPSGAAHRVERWETIDTTAP